MRPTKKARGARTAAASEARRATAHAAVHVRRLGVFEYQATGIARVGKRRIAVVEIHAENEPDALRRAVTALGAAL